MLRKKENKIKNSKSQLIKVGSFFLIVIGICMIGIKTYQNFYLKQEEQQKIDDFMNIQRNMEITKDIEPKEEINEEKKEEPKIVPQNTEDFIAVLEIPKISLEKGIYSKESPRNNVNSNIEILKESDMPDKNNGNFILAGHSGSSKIAYFKNLHKLNKDDIAHVYYNGARYEYKLVNSYEIEKTGEASIIRNGQTTTMTLITCKSNSNKQIVFIFELMKDGE